MPWTMGAKAADTVDAELIAMLHVYARIGAKRKMLRRQ